MRKLIVFAVAVLAIYSCKKDKKADPEPATTIPSVNTDNYSSLDDFYKQNMMASHTFTINAGAGGSFVTAQGTTINIPANTFTPAIANIAIEFKDIYKKSDMLLSNMATTLYNRKPLKSAGEFFIKALNNDTPIAITNTNTGISILQPFKLPVDMGMEALIGAAGADSTKNITWFSDTTNALLSATTSYVFSLYQFSNPLSSGTWCNSDNSSYFSAYTQTSLTIHPNQPLPHMDVFLVFKNVNSMVHVYAFGANFNYYYAPLGLECTVVALGVKDGKLQSSFIPITISVNQTVNFDLTETTTEEFKNKLKAMD